MYNVDSMADLRAYSCLLLTSLFGASSELDIAMVVLSLSNLLQTSFGSISSILQS